jgi:hypothetical protein
MSKVQQQHRDTDCRPHQPCTSNSITSHVPVLVLICSTHPLTFTPRDTALQLPLMSQLAGYKGFELRAAAESSS